MNNRENSINYIELPMNKNSETKQFYNQVFKWEFTDWGPDYISFSGANVNGGFNAQTAACTHGSGVLLVIYTKDILYTLDLVKKAGGTILKSIYEFPGGRRFHFADPNNNELAVWSE